MSSPLLRQYSRTSGEGQWEESREGEVGGVQGRHCKGCTDLVLAEDLVLWSLAHQGTSLSQSAATSK